VASLRSFGAAGVPRSKTSTELAGRAPALTGAEVLKVSGAVVLKPVSEETARDSVQEPEPAGSNLPPQRLPRSRTVPAEVRRKSEGKGMTPEPESVTTTLAAGAAPKAATVAASWCGKAASMAG